MITEKIKGKARQVRAALSGEAGILNTLAGEHAEVESLMEKVSSAERRDDGARRHYAMLRKNLLLHLRAEQQVFYPACQQKPETAALIQSAREDHDKIESLITELDRLGVDGSSWMEVFARLQQAVESHVQDEEEVIFPRCQDHIDKARLRDLDHQYKEVKRSLEETISEITTDVSRPGS